MVLEEAIEYYKEKAVGCASNKTSSEYLQIAKWLEEYKDLQESYGRMSAIFHNISWDTRLDAEQDLIERGIIEPEE